ADAPLAKVRPGPGPTDGHRRVALVERRLGSAVVGGLGHDALVGQLLEDGGALLGTFAVYARLADVVTAVFIGKNVAIVGRQQRPGEIGVVVIPENGALTVRGQLLVDGEDFIETRRWRRHQRLVVDQRRRFHGHGIAPQLAVV